MPDNIKRFMKLFSGYEHAYGQYKVFNKSAEGKLSGRALTISEPPTIKNYHWMDLVTGMLNAYEKGNDTAILVDENNNITEGPGFNLFCVDEKGVFTPDQGVLEGITRQTVFDLAEELNIPISKKPISIEQLKSAKELFATSTAGGVMPITKVSGNKINFGKVGNITRQIHKLYWEKHSAKDWSESVDSILN